LNLIFAAQIIQIFFFCAVFSVASRSFVASHRSSEYLFEGIESEGLYSLGIFFSFWGILIRYIPFDVIFQTETGKIIYSKFMEWDLSMTHYDKNTNELVSCRVQSMQLPE